MKVLMTGATGLIGKQLGKALVRAGHEIVVVARNKAKAELEVPFPCSVIEANLTNGALTHALLSEIEGVIHLAGESVGEGRWTDAKKKRILDSRVRGTENLLESLKVAHQLKTFVAASAIGFYGDRGEELLTESSTAGTDFLADVCVKWEEPYQKLSPQIRTVILRTGVVLSGFGGAFLKMLTPFQMGVGGALGNGKQYLSWIHLDDIVSMYLQALEHNSWKGIYNAVGPRAMTNLEFSQALAKAMKARMAPAVPAFVLKSLLGEMSTLVLASQRVDNHRLKLEKFKYLYPDLEAALKDCCQYYQEGDSLFYAEQFVPLSRGKVFPFFASAENLEKITPDTMSFKIKNKSTAKIEKGTLIDYDLKVHGVPMGWRTLIDDWSPNDRFVDTQLKGPYKKWHHTHEFEDLGGGTLMRDIVRYKLPVGLLGKLTAGKFVEGDVKKIFAYRRAVVPKFLADS